MNEARIFTEYNGTPVHWTVSGDTVDELTGNVTALFGYLDGNGFVGHAGFGTPAKPQPKAAEKPASKARPEAVRCGLCGGDAWDNRAKKRSGSYKHTAPDFSCKNKDGCGGLAWENDEGYLDWKEPRN